METNTWLGRCRGAAITPILTLALAPALVLPLSACGGGYGAEIGATPGGVQDMTLARDLIAAGRVPPPEAFVVEGMYSEHELGLQGAPCETTLCLRGALGLAPTLVDEPSAWLQIGMSSTIDLDAFVRPSLTVVAAVDVSGSMGWDYASGDDSVTPAELSHQLLHALADQLGARDRIAIVTYGSDVETPLCVTSGDEQGTIHAAIDDLDEGGSTRMEDGMERAFAVAREAAGGTDEVRVIVFTDAQPNVGATGAGDFEAIAERGAVDDIGLTVMGLGLGLGQELVLAMSHLRGGNAFSFSQAQQIDAFMEDDWPWFVSPVAYDLSLSMETETGHQLAEAYGFPANATGEVSLDVATVFLSRRKGAVLVRLGDPQGAAIEDLSARALLRYTEKSGQERSQVIESSYQGEALDDRGHYYEQPVVGKTVALAVLVSGMHAAAELYPTDGPGAVEHMSLVHQRFVADAESLADPALDPEVELAAALLALMENGAPQGTLYGY